MMIVLRQTAEQRTDNESWDVWWAKPCLPTSSCVPKQDNGHDQLSTPLPKPCPMQKRSHRLWILMEKEVAAES